MCYSCQSICLSYESMERSGWEIWVAYEMCKTVQFGGTFPTCFKTLLQYKIILVPHTWVFYEWPQFDALLIGMSPPTLLLLSTDSLISYEHNHKVGNSGDASWVHVIGQMWMLLRSITTLPSFLYLPSE